MGEIVLPQDKVARGGRAPQFSEEPLNLTAQVYEQLINILIRAELKPGDVITERRMAERLNASRTPVREALGRLEAEGLVYKQPSRGVTVSPFSTEALLEVLDIRQLLESEAAWRAAGRIASSEIAEIRAALDAMSSNPAPTLEEIWEVDDILHGAIADAAGSALMATIIRDLRRRTHVLNAYRNSIRFGFVSDNNSALLDALENGDKDGAKAAMNNHIETVRTRIIAQLSVR